MTESLLDQDLPVEPPAGDPTPGTQRRRRGRPPKVPLAPEEEILKAIKESAEPAEPAKRDPTPKAKRRTRTHKATTAELEVILGELLTLPAIPARALLECEFCMMHFIVEGPKAAHELALLSENNPALRSLLVRLHAGWTAITWGAVLAAYVGKPLLHHAAPQGVLEAVGPVMGIPPRDGMIVHEPPPGHPHPLDPTLWVGDDGQVYSMNGAHAAAAEPA
jgi:hypothetical protein